MDLTRNDWKHLLRTKTSEKSLLKTFYNNSKVNRKVNSENSLIKEFTSRSNLTVLNTTKISNSFHGQTSLKDTMLSAWNLA